MVWFTKPYFPLLNAKEKEYMIRLKISYSYQQYSKLIFPGLHCLQSHLLSKINIQMHRQKLVRSLGELELVVLYESFNINVTLGENLPCYINHFSVLFQNNTMGISSFSGRLTIDQDKYTNTH